MTEQQPIDDAAFARLFEGAPDGPAVLDNLIRLNAGTAVLTGGIDGMTRTYYNLGRRSVIDYIVRRINAANGVQDNDD